MSDVLLEVVVFVIKLIKMLPLVVFRPIINSISSSSDVDDDYVYMGTDQIVFRTVSSLICVNEMHFLYEVVDIF